VERTPPLGVVVTDLLERTKGPAFVKHRQSPEQKLLLCGEQRIAPTDGCAKCPLAKRQVAVAGSEQVERVIESLEEHCGFENPHPGGGKLQRQRQTVERTTDTGDRGG